MNKRIAVICAFNPLRNTGMYTVDEATKVAIPAENLSRVDYYYLGLNKLDTYSMDECAIRCKQLHQSDAEFRQYEKIIFWGDFLHSYAYWRKELIPRIVAQGICSNESEATELAYEFLMLENLSEDSLRRVAIFGSSAIADDASAIADERFQNALRRLISNAGLVMFRDPITASRYSYLRPGKALIGTDCATLHSVAVRHFVKANGAIGIFVGRSTAVQLLKYVFLIRLFELKTGQKCRWIQWTGFRPFHKYVKWLLGASTETLHKSPEQTIKDLEECSFVITDTYHMCVNAWSRGIPAVCFGSGVIFDSSTLGSKKKESFFTYVFAEKYYFFWENLHFWNTFKIIDQIEKLRQDTKLSGHISKQIQLYATYSLNCLRDFLYK